MKKGFLIPAALLALLSTLNCQLSTVLAQGTAFTYQGRLTDGASTANGNYDMQFALRDTLTPPGNPVGTANTIAPVAVSNGLFTVTLEFGPGIFTGPARWLEIGVRTNGSTGAYTILSPRQKLTPAPYAIYSGNAAQLNGQSANAYVAKAGDTMTGALNLPPNGLTVGGSQLVVSGGAVNANAIAASSIICNIGNSVQASVRGENTGTGPGVWGINDSTGAGVLGTSTSGRGVYGTTAAAGSTIAGVYGENSAAGGTAVVGTALNINSAGVSGVADMSGSTGVYGRGTANGVSGTSTSGNGVNGSSTFGNGVNGTSADGHGVYGRSGASPTSAGVYGENSAAGGTAVIGTALNINSAGVAGVADTSGSTGVYGRGYVNGVVGAITSPGASGAAGVEGIANNPGQWAGYFGGRVLISSDVTVGGNKFFQIDHPFDPANKYLRHSCVESPDVKNIYDGNITTDASGDATVTLPNYFEALNRDFRYQLTVIGQFAQAIVSSKIRGNQFTIKTDKPNVEVSWQVTGIRQDAYMKAHPMVVEQDKPANERGTYLHPELFGQPEEKALSWARSPELWKRLKEERTKPPTSPKP